jgi:hypothetical protein
MRIEHKHATSKQATRTNKANGKKTVARLHSCNVDWNLPLPGNTNVAERLARLGESLTEKMSSHGHTVIEVVGKKRTDVREYRLSRVFLLEYLSRYLAKNPKATVANLGGSLCDVCGLVHRLRDMEALSKELTPQNKQERVALFMSKKLSSQCQQ